MFIHSIGNQQTPAQFQDVLGTGCPLVRPPHIMDVGTWAQSKPSWRTYCGPTTVPSVGEIKILCPVGEMNKRLINYHTM